MDKFLSFRVIVKYIFAKLVYDFWIGIVLPYAVAISEELVISCKEYGSFRPLENTPSFASYVGDGSGLKRKSSNYVCFCEQFILHKLNPKSQIISWYKLSKFP